MKRWFLLVVLLTVSLQFMSERLVLAGAKEDARRAFSRGMSLIEAGRYEEGIDFLLKAYELKPHRNVLFNIARAYTQMGKLDSAIRYFEDYLQLDPPDRERVASTLEELKIRQRLRATVNDGMRAIREGRYAEGISLLNRAYEERPHRNLLFNIARAYESLGDDARAIATYERYIEQGPEDVASVRSRIELLRSRARLAENRSIERENRRGDRERASAPPSSRKTKEKTKAQPGVTDPALPSPDEQAARIAELVLERIKSEGLLQAPQRPDGSDVEEGSSSDDRLRNERLRNDRLRDGRGREDGERGDRPSGSADLAHAAVDGKSPTLADTATAAFSSAPVSLEAKSAAAYEDVVVTASRRAQSPLDAPNAVTIITDEDIRLSGARSIPDLLRRVPGMDVMAMSFSDANVSMRGFNRRIANKLLVLIDGRTAYQDFLAATVWKTWSISLEDIERIEVIRGPGSAVYGAYAYTGIVNVITKRPEQLKGSVLNVAGGSGRNLDSTYQYGEKRGPVGLRVSAAYERGDKYELEFDPKRVDYTTRVENANKSIDSVRFNLYSEYNLKDEGERVFLEGGIWSGFNELYGVAALRNQAIDGREHYVRGGYEGDMFSMKAFWTSLRVDSTPQFFRTGLDDLGSSVRADLISVEPILRPTFDLLGKHSLVLGGEYRFKHLDWDYLNEQRDEHHFAAFFQDEWRIAPSFSAIFSGRLDLHPLIGPLGSPRAALVYKPTPNQAIRATVGTAFRQPTMAETYLDLASSSPVAGAAVRLVGNEDLDPENIVTVDLGYLYQAELGDFEAVLYLNRVSNLVIYQPQPAGGGFDPEIPAYLIGQIRHANDPTIYLAPGAEISLRLFPTDGVDIGLWYAFQYIFEQDTGERYTDSPMHKATAWGQLRTRLGLDFGLSAHFVSSQAWREQRFDAAAPSGFRNDPQPVDASVVMLARMGYRLLDDQLELALSGTNLLDFGGLRHREHPFANRLDARLFASATARF